MHSLIPAYVLAALVCAPLLAAAQPSSTSTPPPAAYVLGPDDQVTIHVLDVPEINGQSQRLDPNGDLRLPIVGRVNAGGLTVDQLAAELVTRLKDYVLEPDVAVSVTDFRSQPVSVIGAVTASGVRQLEGRKTLIEMLSLAGGVAPDAGPTLRLSRRIDRGPIPLPNAVADPSGTFSIVDIDLKALLEGRSPDKNIVIQPHDVISVPRAEMVFVIGEVGRPGPVPLTGGPTVSVMEAVSSAGGTLRTAASGNARILRRAAADQARIEMKVDLKQMMQGKAEDVALQAGDILVIPGSGGRRAAARVLDVAIQAGLLIGSYGVVR